MSVKVISNLGGISLKRTLNLKIQFDMKIANFVILKWVKTGIEVFKSCIVNSLASRYFFTFQFESKSSRHLAFKISSKQNKYSKILKSETH